MKVLILAGGFAKRLGDIGKNTPKALLTVSGKPVIEHILERLEPLADVDGVFVSTNKRFEEDFVSWTRGLRSPFDINLVIEPAMEEGQKLGSIGALQFFIEHAAIDDDLLVINGDNLFEFDMPAFVAFYREKGGFTFGVYDTKDPEEAKKMGVVLTDSTGRVVDFEEKPEHPKTTQVSTGIYAFPSRALPLIKEYISEGNSPDRLGDFLIWLMGRQPIYAFAFEGKWFDIGTPETYRLADEEFGSDGDKGHAV